MKTDLAQVRCRRAKASARRDAGGFWAVIGMDIYRWPAAPTASMIILPLMAHAECHFIALITDDDTHISDNFVTAMASGLPEIGRGSFFDLCASIGEI